MKKAIVTGATGFIGRHLVQELSAQGYWVFAIVRDEPQGRELFAALNNVTVIQSDLSDILSLERKIPDRDIFSFFHIAWDGVANENQKDATIQLSNVQGSVNALLCAERMQAKRFIGAGSIAEKEVLLELEEQSGMPNQGNHYKICKWTAHSMCKVLASKTDIDFLWPIITNAYGAGEVSNRLINSLIRSLLKNESFALTEAQQLYDFIYITDLAKALVLVSEKGENYKEYILGSGDVRKLKHYLDEINAIVNPSVTLEYGKHQYKGVYLKKGDLYNGNLQSLGFLPSISFSTGVEMTASWLGATHA